MAKKVYKCELVAAYVQVVDEKVVLDDKKLGAHRIYPILKHCSHLEARDCPVYKTDKTPDVEGVPISGTDKCSFLISLGRHD